MGWRIVKQILGGPGRNRTKRKIQSCCGFCQHLAGQVALEVAPDSNSLIYSIHKFPLPTFAVGKQFVQFIAHAAKVHEYG